MVKTLPPNTGGVFSVPVRVHASSSQKTKCKQHCNKFNKDLKSGPPLKKKKRVKCWMLAVAKS